MKISILQILLQTVHFRQIYIIKNLLPRVVANCLYLHIDFSVKNVAIFL